MTYYEVLEVAENASEEVICMAYKALAKKYHPDVFKGESQLAEKKMKEINAAYEVLSNAAERQNYDAILREKRMGKKRYDQEQRNAATPEKVHKDNNANTDTVSSSFMYPNEGKSAITIAAFLFLSFVQVVHPYLENEALYNFAMLFGFVDFVFINLIMMIFPMLIGIFKQHSTPKYIKRVCVINSIVLFIISLLLQIFEITDAIGIGWIIAVFYYFINKHILLQIRKANPDRKKSIMTLSVVFLMLIGLFVGGVALSNSVYAENGNINDTSSINNTTSINDDAIPHYTVEYVLEHYQELKDTEFYLDYWVSSYGKTSEALIAFCASSYEEIYKPADNVPERRFYADTKRYESEPLLKIVCYETSFTGEYTMYSFVGSRGQMKCIKCYGLEWSHEDEKPYVVWELKNF